MYSKLRNMWSRATIAAVVAGCLAFSVTATAAPKAGAEGVSSDTYDIVVLGDSLAAGYELGFTASSVPYGFAEHAYEQALFQGLRAEYTNYGIIGLRSEGLSKWLDAAAKGQAVKEADIQAGLSDPRAAAMFGKTTQLAQDLKDAELVLVTIGGNDFLWMLNDLGFETAFDQLPADKQDQLKAQLDTLLEGFEKQLKASLGTIQKLQPNAEIVVANQYLPIYIQIRDQKTYFVPDSTAKFLTDGQARLLERLQTVVAEYSKQGLNVKIADASSAIEKDALKFTSIRATDEKGNPMPDIHPTASGYAALGKAFAEPLWGTYQTVKPRKQGVPISIVVGGKEVITDYAPVIKKGRTFLSLRDVTDALGAELQWNAATSTATITLENRTVAITVGATTISINGKSEPLNAEPAYLQQFSGEKKTYVPLAALSDGLGFQVVYRETLKTAFINR
ncbi:copper amine oxidase [Paenibacillus sp. 1011MAR3C5]|uniref:stalk domain-containing protein n=1 Tax=Paenibacillus sp. 1011MAR3C5 TaxID=1675787 RepID=UPI000E6D3636|nr:stalk domain-containing protein [Paenibacillus sp. 1011MAR3C5]RJE88862.1 copper amine oxidase [Paenibacillus sp. 1011MAR3C5]